MTIELTEAQAQAVRQAGEVLPSVVDPLTTRTYVLVPTETYERMKSLLTEGDEQQKAWLSAARKARLAWVQGNLY